MTLEIGLVPLLKDNYAYLLRCSQTGKTAIVDPSEAQPVLELLAGLGWGLDFILNTHHHADHSGGNLALKAATGAVVVGPRADRERIPGIDVALGDGEFVSIGTASAVALDIPGHTRGHIAFWFEKDHAVFCGDTLFALGCGRMFEGDAPTMWHSLKRLRDLPPDTRVYCGHEYTEANARFALTIEGTNDALVDRSARITELRRRSLPTIPSMMVEERATNPFLRADVPTVAAALGMAGADPVAVFAELRGRKDRF